MASLRRPLADARFPDAAYLHFRKITRVAARIPQPLACWRRTPPTAICVPLHPSPQMSKSHEDVSDEQGELDEAANHAAKAIHHFCMPDHYCEKAMKTTTATPTEKEEEEKVDYGLGAMALLNNISEGLSDEETRQQYEALGTLVSSGAGQEDARHVFSLALRRD